MKKQYMELRISVFRDEKTVFVSKLNFLMKKVDLLSRVGYICCLVIAPSHGVVLGLIIDY